MPAAGMRLTELLAEIAEQLVISRKTASNHAEHIATRCS